ncbi:uncharacterized protein DSM5745_06794 [Aspergillus mulundensis]|uniref:Uncharacterized protein n=1 Tax=Aspergillus mulundensis TaxID=1810919 RepID=A0A3D8RRV0_9EURO|nr:hypothetical protein DSM5745_06794 [Aspergillus mulundensis]RDW76802.1 hypothetical protein DSM5745_06794 [Aspergillus mulundensis]
MLRGPGPSGVRTRTSGAFSTKADCQCSRFGQRRSDLLNESRIARSSATQSTNPESSKDKVLLLAADFPDGHVGFMAQRHDIVDNLTEMPPPSMRHQSGESAVGIDTVQPHMECIQLHPSCFLLLVMKLWLQEKKPSTSPGPSHQSQFVLRILVWGRSFCLLMALVERGSDGKVPVPALVLIQQSRK